MEIQMTLETKRLILRDMAETDFDALYQVEQFIKFRRKSWK